MNPLVKVFIDICLLRIGPQELPRSRFLLLLLLSLHWLLGVAIFLFNLPFGAAVQAALVGTLLMVALVQGALTVRKLTTRFSQTATALAGSELLLGVLMIPMQAWSLFGPDPTLPGLFSMLLLAWSFVITAHILRHSLNVTMSTGLFLALGYMLVSYVISDLVSTGS